MLKHFIVVNWLNGGCWFAIIDFKGFSMDQVGLPANRRQFSLVSREETGGSIVLVLNHACDLYVIVLRTSKGLALNRPSLSRKMTRTAKHASFVLEGGTDFGVPSRLNDLANVTVQHVKP
jgi:hypothetical protein